MKNPRDWGHATLKYSIQPLLLADPSLTTLPALACDQLASSLSSTLSASWALIVSC